MLMMKFEEFRKKCYPQPYKLLKSVKEIIDCYLRSLRGQRKVYLYSFGGCGTKTLYHFLNKHVTVNSQIDIHEGAVRFINRNDAVVYLYGNPIEAVASFYYRNSAQENFVQRHAENMGIFQPMPVSLEDYAKRELDFMRLEQHFDRGIKPSNYAKLAVNYSALWDELDGILQYLNLSHAESEFPAYRKRVSLTSRIECENPDILTSLSRTYGNLFSKIRQLAPVQIINSAKIDQ